MAFLITSVSMLLRIVSEFTTQNATSRSRASVYIIFLCITASFNIIHWVMFIKMEQVGRGTSALALCSFLRPAGRRLCVVCAIGQDLKWKKYKAIGADPGTRKLYLRYELFSALRKVDLQFSTILLVTGVVFFLDSTDVAAGLVPNILLFRTFCRMCLSLMALNLWMVVLAGLEWTELLDEMVRTLDFASSSMCLLCVLVCMCACMCLSGNLLVSERSVVELLWEYMGVTGVKLESKPRMYCFWVLSACLPIFVITVFIESASANQYFNGLKRSSEEVTVIVFAGAAIVSRVATVLASVLLSYTGATCLT